MSSKKVDARAADPRQTILMDLQAGKLPLDGRFTEASLGQPADVHKAGTTGLGGSAASGQSGTFEQPSAPSRADARACDRPETYYNQLAGTVQPKRSQFEQQQSSGSFGRLARPSQPPASSPSAQAPLQASSGTKSQHSAGSGAVGPSMTTRGPMRADARHDDPRETFYGQLAGTVDPVRAKLEQQRGFETDQQQVGKLQRGWDPKSNWESQQRDVGGLGPQQDASSVSSLPTGTFGSRNGEKRQDGDFVQEAGPSRVDARYGDARETYYGNLAGTMEARKAAWEAAQRALPAAERDAPSKLSRGWDPNCDYELKQREVGHLGLQEAGQEAGRDRPSGTALPQQPTELVKEGQPSRVDARYGGPRETYYDKLAGKVDPLKGQFEQQPAGYDPNVNDVSKLDRQWDPRNDWESKQRDVGRLNTPQGGGSAGGRSPRSPGRLGATQQPDTGEFTKCPEPSRVDARYGGPRETYYDKLAGKVDPLKGQFEQQPTGYDPNVNDVGKLDRQWDPKNDWESKQRDVGRLDIPKGGGGGGGSERSPRSPGRLRSRMPDGGEYTKQPAPSRVDARHDLPRETYYDKLAGKVDPLKGQFEQQPTGYDPKTRPDVGRLDRQWDPKDDWESKQRDVGRLDIPDDASPSPSQGASRPVGKLTHGYSPQDSASSQQREVGRLPVSSPPQAAEECGQRPVGKLVIPPGLTGGGQGGAVSPGRAVGKLSNPWDPKDGYFTQQREVGKLPASSAAVVPSMQPARPPRKVSSPVAVSTATLPVSQAGKLSTSPLPPPRTAAKLVTPGSHSVTTIHVPGNHGTPPSASSVGARPPVSPRTQTVTSSRPIAPQPGSGAVARAAASLAVPPPVKPRVVSPRGTGIGMSDFGRSGKPKASAAPPRSGVGMASSQTSTHHPGQAGASGYRSSPPSSGSQQQGGQASNTFMPMQAVGDGGQGSSSYEPGWSYPAVNVGAKHMPVTDNLYTGEVTDFYDPTGVKDHCPKCGRKKAGRDRFCPDDGALYNA